MKTDFQIVGGGLIGLSTAYALQRRGASVRVIESRAGVGEGTSFANAGMLHAFNAAPWNGPGVTGQLLRSLFDPGSAMKLRLKALPGVIGWGLKFIAASRSSPHWYATRHNYALAVNSMAHSEQWRTVLDMDIDHRSTGLLNIVRTQKDLDRANALTHRLEEYGFQMQALNPSQVIEKEPALAPIGDRIKGAIYYPDDYSADAYKFCKALATEIQNQDGEIITDTKMSEFIRENGNIIGVKTDKSDFMAGTTIVAAGARSAPLLQPLGLGVSVRPVKGYSLTFDKLKGGQTLPVVPVVDDSLHAAITPLGERLRIAGTAEITGFDQSLPESRLRPLLAMLDAVYPELAAGVTLAAAKPWAGFRPVSADGIPFIGKTSIPGLALNTGHGHMGWTLAAGSGELLADILTGTETELDAAPFDPGR